MKWLSLDEVRAWFGSERSPPPTQVISIPIDYESARVSEHLNEPSRDTPKKRLVKGVLVNPVWYTVIDNVVIAIEDSSGIDGPHGVEIYIPYPEDGLADWTNIRRLSSLPSYFHVKQPRLIESRVSDEDHVVVREENGWEEILYRAKTVQEARELEVYLADSVGKWRYFAAPSEPKGDWNLVIVEGTNDQTYGIYKSKYDALRDARLLSTTKRLLKVQHATHSTSTRNYLVRNGRVV